MRKLLIFFELTMILVLTTQNSAFAVSSSQSINGVNTMDTHTITTETINGVTVKHENSDHDQQVDKPAEARSQTFSNSNQNDEILPQLTNSLKAASTGSASAASTGSASAASTGSASAASNGSASAAQSASISSAAAQSPPKSPAAAQSPQKSSAVGAAGAITQTQSKISPKMQTRGQSKPKKIKFFPKDDDLFSVNNFFNDVKGYKPEKNKFQSSPSDASKQSVKTDSNTDLFAQMDSFFADPFTENFNIKGWGMP